MLVEEDDESVAVLILICGDSEPTGAYTDCPTHVYLDEPLGGRAVVDVLGGRRPVPYVNVYEELEKEFGLPRSQPQNPSANLASLRSPKNGRV